jgi:cytochrome c5
MSNHSPKVDPVSWLVFIASAVSILLAVYFLITSLVNTVNSNSTKGELDNTMQVAAASDNLAPIGHSLTSDAKPAAAAAARSGKEVYDAVCTVCHATGVAGAPKISDKAAWEPRVATGIDALMNTAINGKGAMPARGGNPSVTDAELKATIAYMTKQAGFDLGITDEPAAAAVKEEAAPVAATEEKVSTEAEKPAPATEEKPTASADAPTEPENTVEAPAAQKAVVEPIAPEAPTAPEVAAPVAAAAAVVETASAAAPSAADLEKGKTVYSKTCFACHATGVAGSPKLDDKAAWAPRIATGMDALYHTALNGKGAMPAKGGSVDLSDEDVKAAVDYMVSEAK